MRTLRTRLGFDQRELQSRRAFFDIQDEDLARLAELRELALKHMDDINEEFYTHLLSHPETKRFFPDDATIRRVKRLQREYFLGLFEGRCDLEYVENRLRVGAAHEQIGMSPRWYIGAYRKYLSQLLDRFTNELPVGEGRIGYDSVLKLIMFDMSLAIDAYIAANLETLGRHQAAIRELSTPVIKVQDRILLLPLIGAIDSQRAQQVMETVLLRVIEEKAKVMIIDIAGVPVVDTKVADHLMKTTAAMRLVGAQTILTGISAQVARTIIQLGVDISAMPTLARLQDGIELALSMLGQQITKAST
ncbi:MAG: STAS domain-containing protein [Deltaproteobacteria bacterium]|nr:STAS domain-containing protein [Deltaproteobacteria bacterium]